MREAEAKKEGKKEKQEARERSGKDKPKWRNKSRISSWKERKRGG